MLGFFSGSRFTYRCKLGSPKTHKIYVAAVESSYEVDPITLRVLMLKNKPVASVPSRLTYELMVFSGVRAHHIYTKRRQAVSIPPESNASLLSRFRPVCRWLRNFGIRLRRGGGLSYYLNSGLPASLWGFVDTDLTDLE